MVKAGDVNASPAGGVKDMTMKQLNFKRALSLTMICVLCGATCVAAQTPKQAAQKGAAKRAKQAKDVATDQAQQTAIYTLEEAVASARQLENPFTKIHLQTLVAEALWSTNESRAREIFIQALSDAADTDDAVKAQLLQRDVIKRAWLKSPALGRQLMEKAAAGQTQQTQGVAAPQTTPTLAVQFGMKSPDPLAQQQLLLGGALIQDDPEAAAKLIRQGAESGATFALANYLMQLREKNPTLSDDIFLETLNRLPSMQTSAALSIAVSMTDYVSPNCALCPQQQIASDRVGRAYYAVTLSLLRRSVGQPVPIMSEQQSAQARVEQLQRQAQAMLAMRLTDLARRYNAPEGAELQAIYQDAFEKINPRLKPTIDLMERTQRSDDRFETAFHEVESIPDQSQRDETLVRLVEIALQKGLDGEGLARLEQKIEKIKTPALHDRARSLFDLRQIEIAIKSKDVERALKLCERLPSGVMRAGALADVASALQRAGDRARALEVLGESLRQADKADGSLDRSATIFKIVSSFVSLKDDAQSFEALLTAADSLSRLRGDDFSKSQSDEVMPEKEFDFGTSFGRLAKVDFNRSLQIAQTIRWRELRLPAEIAVCRSVLDGR
jgi:tetratricopeptide (TPR) repeat protein